jgi:arginyl-tRNA synthetase
VTPDRLSSSIVAALDGLVDDDELTLPTGVPATAALRRPRSPRHGDYSTNVALLLAVQARRPALELAGMLAGRLRDTAGIRSVEVAPPGFVNVRLDVGWSVAARVLEQGAAYGAAEGARADERAVFGQRREDAGHRDGDPLYVVQRAHARAGSLLRAGAELGIDVEPGEVATLDQALPSSAEAALLGLLADFPDTVARAARRRGWRHLGRVLVEVATGLLDLDATVLPRGDEPPSEAHRARLMLVAATRVVLANGLSLAATTPAERW